MVDAKETSAGSKLLTPPPVAIFPTPPFCLYVSADLETLLGVVNVVLAPWSCLFLFFLDEEHIASDCITDLSQKTKPHNI